MLIIFSSLDLNKSLLLSSSYLCGCIFYPFLFCNFLSFWLSFLAFYSRDFLPLLPLLSYLLLFFNGRLSKIIGIKENNIGGEGEIYYPKGYNIYVITQQDYFPLIATLEEIIFYPNKINKEKKQYILELLKEVGLDGFFLKQQENWYNV